MKFRCGWIAVLLVASHTSPCRSQSFHGLDYTTGAQTIFSAVTAHGEKIFGTSGIKNASHPLAMFEWTAANGITAFPAPANTERPFPSDTTPNGTVIVGRVSPTGLTVDELQAFRYTADAGIVRLGDFPGGRVRSSAHAVSDDGQTIVGFGTGATDAGFERLEAFRWTPSAGMQGIGFLPGNTDESIATDVSSDGSVIIGNSTRFETVGEFTLNHTEAFRWTSQGGMIGLGELPGGDEWSLAKAVTPDGNTIVGLSYSANGAEAFRWTKDGGMVGLGIPPVAPAVGIIPFSDAEDISADGSIIVGATTSGAAVWDERHGFRTVESILTAAGVDLGGWHLRYASKVSADGRTVIGSGENYYGTLYWVAKLPDSAFAVPEPQTSLLAAIYLAVYYRTFTTKRSRLPANPC